MLRLHSRAPWDYAKFLDFASDRQLMRKIGGGYIFFHRMLMEHFAQRHQTYRKPIPLTPRQTAQPIPQTKTRTKARSRNNSDNISQPSKPIQNHIFCSSCGHRNPTEGKFCTKCGSKLVEPS